MCGVSARESVSGGNGRGCWMRDVLMFVWLKFCSPRRSSNSGFLGFKATTEPRGGSHVR